MKQHITSEQLRKLSEREQKELFEWCGKTGHLETKQVSTLKYPIPRLSIGQMIKFLEESHHIEIFDHKDGWNVRAGLYSADKLELCDALWKAVKVILAKEE